jgi:hypothetical protein
LLFKYFRLAEKERQKKDTNKQNQQKITNKQNKQTNNRLTSNLCLTIIISFELFENEILRLQDCHTWL